MSKQLSVNKERNCVIEILRIVSMALVVCGHAILYSGDYEGTDSLLILGIEYICKPAVNIFVIITGYFMSVSDFSTKRLLRIWLQTVFYSVLIYLCTLLLGNGFNIEELVKTVFPISLNQYWFARVYVYLYLCSPFINILLNRLTVQNYHMMFVVGIILMVIPSSIPGIESFNPEGGNGILWFIMLYCTGAYLHKYPPKCKTKTGIIWACILLCFSMIMEIVITRISIWLGFDGRGASRFSTYDSFPIYGAAIGVFLTFLQISRKDIKSRQIRNIISFFSTSSFSVYLIHEHPNVRMILWDALHILNYRGWTLYGLLIITVVGIFCASAIVDKLTWNNFCKLFDKVQVEKMEFKVKKLLRIKEINSQ